MAANQLNIGMQNNQDGAQLIIARGGRLGETMVSELHGKFFEQTRLNNTFRVAVAGVTTTAGLATTYTGLVIANPIGSGVNTSILKLGYAFTVAFPGASVVGLMVGYSGSTNVTLTTPITPHNGLINGSYTGKTLAASSATLQGTPTLDKVFASGLTGAITTEPFIAGDTVDIDGAIVLPPGGWCAFYTSAVSGSSGSSFSFAYEEVPV